MAVVLAGLVAFGGCGEDEPSTADGARSAFENAEKGGTGQNGDGENTGVAGGEGAGNEITSQQCLQTAAAMAEAASAVPQALSGTGADLGESVNQLEAFAKAAPDEIRSDLEVVARAYASVIAILEEANFDPRSGQPPSSAVIQKLQTVGQQLDQPEFKAAGDRVGSWFNQECGQAG